MHPRQRREVLKWGDIDGLIDHLLPQFRREFTAMLMITRGGIIPGGMLAEAMNITHLLTAAVDFPAESMQFPVDTLLRGRPTLIVDDVWGSGRTITAVKNRVSSAGGFPETCVLHFNPNRSLFGSVRPDYYAAITDAYIVYPWEIDRGADKLILGQ
jgi:hypoxanthine phosphoribosyltransferase